MRGDSDARLGLGVKGGGSRSSSNTVQLTVTCRVQPQSTRTRKHAPTWSEYRFSASSTVTRISRWRSFRLSAAAASNEQASISARRRTSPQSPSYIDPTDKRKQEQGPRHATRLEGERAPGPLGGVGVGDLLPPLRHNSLEWWGINRKSRTDKQTLSLSLEEVFTRAHFGKTKNQRHASVMGRMMPAHGPDSSA